MLNQIQSIALRRLHLLAVPRGNGLSAEAKWVLLADLSKVGCQVTNPEVFDSIDASYVDERHASAVETLTTLKGGDVDYVPLFLKWPDLFINDTLYLAKRLTAMLMRAFDFGDAESIFNNEEFGADPVSQMQTAEQFHDAQQKLQARSADGHVEWTKLQLVFDDEIDDHLREFLRQVLTSKSSIRTAWRADIEVLLAAYGALDLTANDMPHKEVRALVSAHAWTQNVDVTGLLSTPTDVLRMFAQLTSTDVSLAGEVKFPSLNRRQRRAVLDVLEQSPVLAEDLLRHERLWKKIRRGLHPGDWAQAYPKCNRAFTELSADTLRSFAGLVERAIARLELDALLSLLAARPGEFARRLHRLLRVFPDDTEKVLAAFSNVTQHIPLKNLLVLQSLFATVNDEEERVFILKNGKVFAKENDLKHALSSTQVSTVGSLLNEAVRQQLSAGDGLTGQRVWLDPILDVTCVALQERAMSDGMVPFARGSRIRLTEEDKVLRLFVYWKENGVRTDLDLSLMCMDECFDNVGHVSWTQLSGKGIKHSGDIQSAPHGAAEFIDIDLSALESRVRFVAPQVHRYCGASFAELTCHAGWMMRGDVSGDIKTFDVATVMQKFNLQGVASFCIPFVIDVQRKELIVVDLYVGNRALHNTVERASSVVSRACRGVEGFVRSRPTLSSLVLAHVKAQGAVVVDSKEDAELTFGLENCDVELGHPQVVLSTWLAPVFADDLGE